MKILIVDDQPSNRLIAKFLVESEGHTSIEARDGQDAIEKFMQHKPDFVLMDIVMPRMDGYESAYYIKSYSEDKYIPIIFLTAKHDEASLLKCLECGGDDYLIKPINGTLLKAKIRAHLRTLELTQQIQAKNTELSLVYANLAREHEMGRHVLSHILDRNLTDCPNIQQYMSSMSTFNGDLFLLAENPNGGLYIFLGDFTGHGLAAAIGTIPLSQLFFSMCDKGDCISDIVTAMNHTLKIFLPEHMFCAATMIHLYERGDSAQIWTGGLPDAYIVRCKEGIVQTVCSKNMPLGILSDEDFNNKPSFVRFKRADKLIMFSDGILEVACPNTGEMFGEQRLKQVFESKEINIFKALVDNYNDFIGKQKQQDDDISLIEVLAQPYEAKVIRDLQFNKENKVNFIPWSMSLNVEPKDIKAINVVNNIISLLPSFIRISYRFDVFRTILSELYSNSLEHGLLNLSSSMKATPDGFGQYYQLRDQRLEELIEGFIRVHISSYTEDKKIKSKITIEDSGEGFKDYEDVQKDKVSIQPWGRGLSLVKSLSEKVIYSNKGSKVEVILRLS
ncbi:MAG: CheY-like chemotaxis protein [Oleiphilaceae bacterium]